ncbi:uncharacterized protein LOC134217075 [Armigeres subalbatus]|uniref:uncharacterized protein LOC134217075 n=1 Tax=Armigeres subalbatus TaxID=124917 RepID=UPI002ED64F30
MVNKVIILILLYMKGGTGARVKEYIQEEAAICPQPNADKFVIQFPGQLNFTTGISSVEFHGNFTITDVIQEPLELVIHITRCTLDNKTCDQFNKLTLTNICRYVNDEKGPLVGFFKSMEPKIRCPIKPGAYRFKNSLVDLSFTTIYPMEGYRWKAHLKLNSRRPKRELFCVFSQSIMRWTKKT